MGVYKVASYVAVAGNMNQIKINILHSRTRCGKILESSW